MSCGFVFIIISTKRGQACSSGSWAGAWALRGDAPPAPSAALTQAPWLVQGAGRAGRSPCGAVRRRVSVGPAGSVDSTERADGGAAWGMASWGCVGGSARLLPFHSHSRSCPGPQAPLRGGSGAAGPWRAWVPPLCVLGPLLPAPERVAAGSLLAASEGEARPWAPRALSELSVAVTVSRRVS